MVVNSQYENVPILLGNIVFIILSDCLVSKINQTAGAADIGTKKPFPRQDTKDQLFQSFFP